MAETAMDGILSADSRGLLVYANRSAGRIFGYEAEDLVGQPITAIMPERFREAHRRGFARILATGRGDLLGRTVELAGLCRDGREVPVELSLSSWSTAEGAFFTAVVRDISERKRAEEALGQARHDLELRVEERTRELKEALDALHEASRLKDEFLATLSHELRTPLNAIYGWAKMLRSGALDDEAAARAVEIIDRNAEAQSQLVADILDMSRIVTGALRLDVRAVDPARIAEQALDTVRPAAEAKGLHMEFVTELGAGPVLADPDRLQQVLWNLLANAVKFTPRAGRVELTLRRVASQVEISVRDTGIGIRPEFLPRVFERFSQADSSSTRPYRGLGLGLAIVRQLVELQGGTVHAHSAGEGQGSLFTLRLPVMVLADAPARADVFPPGAPTTVAGEPPSLSGLRVLVVDDEADARDLVVATLKARGADVVTAASCAEGLQVASRSDPDVVLCDIEMPGEDGYQFITTLRARESEAERRIPAAALTAYARGEDRLRALRTGFDMHLPKPLTPAELIGAVATLGSRGPRSG